LSVSSTSIVIRHLVGFPALALAFWRMFTASGLLWGYSATTRTGTLSKENLVLTFFAGVFLGLHFSCFFWGVRNTSIANATLLANTGPFFTALFAFIKQGTLKKPVLIGLGLAFVGLISIQMSEGKTYQDNFLGDFVSLLSGLSIAVTYSYAKKIRRGTSAVVYGRTLFFFASLTILVIWMTLEPSPILFEKTDLGWILFLGFVPSILGHNSLNYSIKYLSPTAIASVPLGEPIIASLLGFVIFSEPVPIESLISAPFIFFGIYLILKHQEG
jgi:drug/metabolite transporter (DMT)-like permease